MMNFTEIKQESSDAEENKDEFIGPITSNNFNYQLTAIKQEESLVDEDGIHPNKMPSLIYQVKTEPQSEGEEDGYELENISGDYPPGYVIKREITEVNTEDQHMRDDEVNQRNTTEDEDCAIEKHPIVKYENHGDFSADFLDQSRDEQESVSGITSREMNDQQICGRIANKTGISQIQAKTKKDHKCSVCRKSFHDTQACLQHVWNTHTGADPYSCEVCGKGFKYLSTLEIHQAVHSDDRPFSCDLCQKTFKLKQNLDTHKRTIHSDEKPFSCDICKKAFKQKIVLQNHKVSCHSNERPYTCDFCKKAFKQKVHLDTHKRTVHSDEKLYSCDVCEKAFKEKGVLQRHKVSCHSNERPFSCDLCNKAFKHKSVLQNHKVLCHSDERPYSCDFCEKTFKLKEILYLHVTTVHSDERPYSCNVCNKSFKQKQILRRHKVLCHSVERSQVIDS